MWLAPSSTLRDETPGALAVRLADPRQAPTRVPVVSMLVVWFGGQRGFVDSIAA